MEDDLRSLHEQLIRLQAQLRSSSRAKYNRINPFAEDLFDWKERGDYWAGTYENVTIYNTTTIIGDVTIGAHTWIGPYCSLDGSASLSIGKYCSISTGVQIVTHDTVLWALSGGKIRPQIAPITVGNYCFVGSHVVITKGVSIGDHCLVAAGSVVTRDIPSCSIAAGVPANIIGRVLFSEDGQVKLEYFSKSELKGN